MPATADQGATAGSWFRRRSWTDEQLVEAVRVSGSKSEVMRRLGVTSHRSTTWLDPHLERLGINADHLRRHYRRYGDEELTEAVATSDSLAEALRKLGVSAASSHQHFARRVERLGIDTSHFGQRPRRSAKRRTPDEILVRMPDDAFARTSGALLTRALLEKGLPYECKECSLGTTWQGRPLVLQVEHIDGDWRNCLQENLCFLCPNCHSQTPTFANRNQASCQCCGRKVGSSRTHCRSCVEPTEVAGTRSKSLAEVDAGAPTRGEGRRTLERIEKTPGK